MKAKILEQGEKNFFSWAHRRTNLGKVPPPPRSRINRRFSTESPFLQKATFESLQKQVKAPSKISLFVLLPSNNDSWMCSCIMSSWENGIPLNKIFTLGGRLFNPPKGKHVLKRSESHLCEVNTSEILACNFHFRKSLTESERSGRF